MQTCAQSRKEGDGHDGIAGELPAFSRPLERRLFFQPPREEGVKIPPAAVKKP